MSISKLGSLRLGNARWQAVKDVHNEVDIVELGNCLVVNKKAEVSVIKNGSELQNFRSSYEDVSPIVAQRSVVGGPNVVRRFKVHSGARSKTGRDTARESTSERIDACAQAEFVLGTSYPKPQLRYHCHNEAHELLQRLGHIIAHLCHSSLSSFAGVSERVV